MSRSQHIRSEISSAIEAASGEDSEDAFDSIVQFTRNCFRPKKRMKIMGKSFKRRTFLCRRANSDFFPIKSECLALTESGLGYTKSTPVFKCEWTIEQVELYIHSLYPTVPLELVGFKLGKCDRKKRINGIHIEGAWELKAMLEQSILIIIPNRDLPCAGLVGSTNTRNHTIIGRHTLNTSSHNNIANIPMDNIRQIRNETQHNRNATVTGENVYNSEESESSSSTTINKITGRYFRNTGIHDNTAVEQRDSSRQISNEIQQNRNAAVTSENGYGSPESGRSPSSTKMNGRSLEYAGRYSGTSSTAVGQTNMTMYNEPEYDGSNNVTNEIGDFSDEAEHDILTMNQAYISLLITPGTLLSGDMESIEIERAFVVQEMLTKYSDEALSTKLLYVSFKNESGSDLGGLTKELFCIFWQEVEKTFFNGEDLMVPFLPLHRSRKEKTQFQIIGRILDHGVCITNTFPQKLSRILGIGNPDVAIDLNIILDDFLLFITNIERKLVKKVLKNFDSLTESEMSMLSRFFTSYGLYEIPKKKEIKDQIASLATDVMYSKPLEFVKEMSKGINELHLEQYWSKMTVADVNYIRKTQQPTNEKVVNCIETSEDYLRNDEEKVLYYLHNYIYSLNDAELKQFLLFVTGATEMPQKIKVTFMNITGLLLRPIGHTCSNTLELSTAYDSYQHFKSNMAVYLQSEFSYQYTQI